MKARIHITLKAGVLDPQGAAVQQSLRSLGFDDVHSVRQGKIIDLELNESNAQTAKDKLKAMCEQLLANTVIEDYTIELI